VNELSSFQSKVAEEAEVKVREIIALSDRNNITKIDELTSRVNRIQGGLAVNDSTQTRPTADQLIVGEPNPGCSTSVTHAGMSNAMNIVSDCSQCENDVSLNARASRETDLHAAVWAGTLSLAMA
jgi:hypothetical protein